MPKKKSTTKKNASKSTKPTTAIRLQRFLAQAGYGSRRECEELITEGRVTVEGKVVNKLGSRVEPDCMKVRMDGSKVAPTRMQYFMVHKPTGVLSTCSDPEGRLRVIDLIKTDQRVYNVGRLDKSSEGLILVTNDGDLANRLTHPRYGVQKTYHVTVAGNPRWEDLEMLKRGIRLAEAVARVSDVQIKKRHRDVCDLVMMLEEGRNREIRRLLAHIGHKVIRLRRVAIGPLHLGDLKGGDYRRLEPKEIDALRLASSTIKKRATRRERPIETSQLPGRKKDHAEDSSGGRPTKKSVRSNDRPGKSSDGIKSKTGRNASSDRSTKKSVRSKDGPGKSSDGIKSKTGRNASSGRSTKKSVRSKGRPGKSSDGIKSKTGRNATKTATRKSTTKGAKTAKGNKKKRPATTESRRGAGRLVSTVGRKKPGKKKVGRQKVGKKKSEGRGRPRK